MSPRLTSPDPTDTHQYTCDAPRFWRDGFEIFWRELSRRQESGHALTVSSSSTSSSLFSSHHPSSSSHHSYPSTQAEFCAANLTSLSAGDRAVWEQIRLHFQRVFEEHHAAVARCLDPARLLTLPLGDPHAAAKVVAFLGCSAPAGLQAMPHVTGANAAAASRMRWDDEATAAAMRDARESIRHRR